MTVATMPNKPFFDDSYFSMLREGFNKFFITGRPSPPVIEKSIFHSPIQSQLSYNLPMLIDSSFSRLFPIFQDCFQFFKCVKNKTCQGPINCPLQVLDPSLSWLATEASESTSLTVNFWISFSRKWCRFLHICSVFNHQLPGYSNYHFCQLCSKRNHNLCSN